MSTPKTEEAGPPVAGGFHFTLYDNPDKQWLDWSPDRILIDAEQQQVDPVRLRQ